MIPSFTSILVKSWSTCTIKPFLCSTTEDAQYVMFFRAVLRVESSVLIFRRDEIDMDVAIWIGITCMQDSILARMEWVFMVHLSFSRFDVVHGTPEDVELLELWWEGGNGRRLSMSSVGGIGWEGVELIARWVKLSARSFSKGAITSIGGGAFTFCWKSSHDVHNLLAWELRSGPSSVSVSVHTRAPRESAASRDIFHSISSRAKVSTTCWCCSDEILSLDCTRCRCATLCATDISFLDGLCATPSLSTSQQREQRQQRVALLAGIPGNFKWACMGHSSNEFCTCRLNTDTQKRGVEMRWRPQRCRHLWDFGDSAREWMKWKRQRRIRRRDVNLRGVDTCEISETCRESEWNNIDGKECKGVMWMQKGDASLRGVDTCERQTMWNLVNVSFRWAGDLLYD